MKQLGTGGFMGVMDIKPGMRVVLTNEGAEEDDLKNNAYTGEILEQTENSLLVQMEEDKQFQLFLQSEKRLQIRVVVDNTVYAWNNLLVKPAANRGQFSVVIQDNPMVSNRRKYPRMPLMDSCTVKMFGVENGIESRMVNISAGGFAFSTRDSQIADKKGTNIIITIPNLKIPGCRVLQGRIIRISQSEGQYIVGCRMPEDNLKIRDYINANYHGE